MKPLHNRNGRSLRLREVVGDEVGALEEQENVAEAVTLQGAVQRNPVGILEGTQRRKHVSNNNADAFDSISASGNVLGEMGPCLPAEHSS